MYFMGANLYRMVCGKSYHSKVIFLEHFLLKVIKIRQLTGCSRLSSKYQYFTTAMLSPFPSEPSLRKSGTRIPFIYCMPFSSYTSSIFFYTSTSLLSSTQIPMLILSNITVKPHERHVMTNDRHINCSLNSLCWLTSQKTHFLTDRIGPAM